MLKSFMHTFTPPMRHGVTASQVFLPAQSTALTLYQHLCQHFPHITPAEWQQRFDDHLIYSATGEILTMDCAYAPYANQVLYYYRHLAHETVVPFDHHILFENDDLLVVDKPHFLTMSPTGQYVQQTLLTRLKQHTQNPQLSPIHRLDRETAGIVLFCKRAEQRGVYQQLFAQHQVQKIYHAIAPYRADLVLPQTVQLHLQKGEPFYTMHICSHATPNSETEIEILHLEPQRRWAKYQLKPKTGKQHQLRVHLNYLGIPILHDTLYPQVQHKAADDF
ncbi:MAG: pseudouridine synthase, partial [Acinetobacter sp.]|nr:pseudouridine synthase [Acinetobacter sp.]